MRGADEFTRKTSRTCSLPSGTATTVYAVGGAAIALRSVSSDRRTADVDALMVPEELVLEAAREVAAERGVRSTWLNSAARPYVPPLSEALQPPGAPGLEVRTAPDEHLLAMKIVARGQRDMRDIVPLARRLGFSEATDLVESSRCTARTSSSTSTVGMTTCYCAARPWNGSYASKTTNAERTSSAPSPTGCPASGRMVGDGGAPRGQTVAAPAPARVGSGTPGWPRACRRLGPKPDPLQWPLLRPNIPGACLHAGHRFAG